MTTLKKLTVEGLYDCLRTRDLFDAYCDRFIDTLKTVYPDVLTIKASRVEYDDVYCDADDPTVDIQYCDTYSDCGTTDSCDDIDVVSLLDNPEQCAIDYAKRMLQKKKQQQASMEEVIRQRDLNEYERIKTKYNL